MENDDAFVDFAKMLGINLNDSKFQKPKPVPSKSLDQLNKALKNYGSK